MTCDAIVARLKSMANPENVAGMARFGINPDCALGISVKDVRSLGKEGGRDHTLALELWETGIHEARILASILRHPDWVTEDQMEAWVADFDSWDVCDQVCGNLFDRTPWAYEKPWQWACREEEFVRRAAFALIAYLAVHDKKADDARLASFFPLIEEYSFDSRNYVKKAVNWALRQVGKRSPDLREQAIEVAERVVLQGTPSARWIGRDAFRELTR